MTSIDRTIYRRVKRSYTTKELIEAYTPTEEERHYVETTARSPQHRLNLMLWIKLFPLSSLGDGPRSPLDAAFWPYFRL